MKNIREALYMGASLLESSETPFLDASLILSHILNVSREKLFASYPDPVDPRIMERYMEAVKKRAANYPVAYIVNEKDFFGLPFYVDERVLSPRPDTETLVETALQVIDSKKNIKKVLDLCSGSGCIGISIKHSFPEIEITCSDISPDAIDVCRYNSEKLKVPVKTNEGSLFENISGTFDMIVSNPPYVTTEETDAIYKKGSAEPRLALDGGEDGLDIIRRIIIQSRRYLSPGGYLLLESSIDQTYIIKRILDENGYTETAVIKDLTDRNRVTLGRV